MSEDKNSNAKIVAAEGKSEKPVSLFDDVIDMTVRKAKKCQNITKGICNILATFNNTKVCFASPDGNLISWATAGKCNFHGSRKSTAYAAQMVVQDTGKAAMSHGMKEVRIRVNGSGMGRDSAIRTIQSLGLIVDEIIDVTPIQHNGCRPRKVRRA
jgi:small subunit ribosomal protein S11